MYSEEATPTDSSNRSNTAPGFVGALALFLPLENPDGEQLHIQSGDTKTDLAEFSQFETSLLAWYGYDSFPFMT